MKQSARALSIVVLTVSSFGCKDDNVAINTSVNIIHPLSVGSVWIFGVTQYDTLGNPLNTSLPDFWRKIYYDTLIANERWFSFSENREYFGFNWRTNKNDGLWQRDMYARSYLLYKFPAAINDSYQWSNGDVTVLSTNQVVSVPLGTFSCIKYQMVELPYQTLWGYIYVAPNIGEIKYENVERTLGGSTYIYKTYELKTLVLH